MDSMVPATGAGTSTVTLSVSSSTSGSSTEKASPTCLCHFPTTASVIDSPSCGTFNSNAMEDQAPFPNAASRMSLVFQLVGLGEPVAGLAEGARPM